MQKKTESIKMTTNSNLKKLFNTTPSMAACCYVKNKLKRAGPIEGQQDVNIAWLTEYSVDQIRSKSSRSMRNGVSAANGVTLNWSVRVVRKHDLLLQT